jgi:protein O-GlcNAc transferase
MRLQPVPVLVIAAVILFRGGMAQAAVQIDASSTLQQADAAYRAGVAALNANDLRTARMQFQKVVRLAPQAEEGHSAYGSVLLRTGATAEGIRELEKALSIKDSDTTAQLNLALAYAQTGAGRRAIPLFARLESAEHQKLPGSALEVYASALAGNGQFADAEREIQNAMRQEPGNAEWPDVLGSLYAQQHRWTQAQVAFEQALRLDPKRASAHLHLGLALAAQQKPSALSELQQAAQLAPENPLILTEVGRALAGSGADRQAIPYLQRALRLGGGNTGAKYQLALALQRTGQTREALPLLEDTGRAEPRNSEVLTNLGLALMQDGRAKDAVPYLLRSVALAPGNTVAHQNLAGAYIEINQVSDAVQQLRVALKLSPNSPQLHYNLGLALKMEDDNAGAIPEFEAAARLDPSGPEAPYALGMLYMQNGQYADAARELNTSLKLRPRNGDGWATLGSVYTKLDKLPEAEGALKEAIRQMPYQAEPHLTLATVLTKEGQSQEAAAERKRGADLMRAGMNRQRAEVASNEGNTLLGKGQLSDAISQYQTALGYDASYAAAHRGLANAFERAGKPLEAAAERRKADALDKQKP